MSDSVTTSGGIALITFTWCPATWASTRCLEKSGPITSCEKKPGWIRSSSRQERCREAGSSNSIAHSRPSPRTSFTDSYRSDSGRVSSSSSSPMRAECSTRPLSASSWSVASPAAIARSFGAKVEPCAVPCSSESNTASCTLCRSSSAPVGDVAARERLRDGDEVGLEPPVLQGEQLPGAPEARLHLVDAEERPVAPAELLRALEVAGLGQVDAVALHRLDDEERDVLAAQLGLEPLEIVERDERHARQQRLEPLTEDR